MPPRKRLRIAQFTYGVQPRGGVVHALSLTEALCDLGHDAELFALDETGRGLFREPRCPVTYVPLERDSATDREPLALFVRRRIAALAASFSNVRARFDVHHAHDGIGGNALATLVEHGTVERFVRTVHHLDTFADPEVAALQDRSVRAAARCLVVSDLWRRTLDDRFGISAAVVPSGVDLGRFSPTAPAERRAIRARLGIGEEPFYVTIGGVEQRKNARGTLAAFARVRASEPHARLTIAGGASVFDHGSYRAAFESLASELGLGIGTDVTVTGPISDDAIVALLRAADAFVFPSLVEGFGLVVLEALACGTPVVVSNQPPFTEYLSSQHAIFVDPSDPASIAAGMLRALDAPIATALRTRGPAVAARHTWAASAAQHVARYREYERENTLSRKDPNDAGDAVYRAVAG